MFLLRGMFGINVFKLVFSLIIVYFSLAAPLAFFISGTSSDAFIVAGFGGKVEAEELTIGDFTKLLLGCSKSFESGNENTFFFGEITFIAQYNLP